MKVTPLYIIMLALWVGTVMFLTDKLMIKLLSKQVNNPVVIIRLENFDTNKFWRNIRSDWDNFIHSTNSFHVAGNSYTTNYVENGVNVIVITWTNGVGSFTLEKKENYEHTYN